MDPTDPDSDPDRNIDTKQEKVATLSSVADPQIFLSESGTLEENKLWILPDPDLDATWTCSWAFRDFRKLGTLIRIQEANQLEIHRIRMLLLSRVSNLYPGWIWNQEGKKDPQKRHKTYHIMKN